MKRRNLVIVRAGDKSLHPDWLLGPEPRSWDLVVSYFGDDPDKHRAEDVVRIDSKGPKWPPLQAMLRANPQFVEDYDHIWLPDDDLAMTKADMNRFFEVCAQARLEMAQPSLTADSPVTHPLVLNNTWCRLRYSNFVEVMAPCFSSACLARVLPTLDGTQSGWGIDWIWPRLVADKLNGIAIVDEVVIRHTRPLGGPNYDAMRAAGLLPTTELDAFNAAHGVVKTQIEFHRVVLRSGEVREIRGRSLFLLGLLTLGFAHALRVSPARRQLLVQIAKLLKQPFR